MKSEVILLFLVVFSFLAAFGAGGLPGLQVWLWLTSGLAIFLAMAGALVKLHAWMDKQ
jgi:hypothetical protein